MRRLLCLLAALAVFAALSGCGADDLSPTSIARAADATIAKNGMKIQIDQTMTVPGAGPVTMTGAGAIDTRGQASHLTMKLTGMPGGGTGGLDADDLTTEVITDRLVVYTRTPQLGSALGQGKSWLKVDLAEAAKGAGIDLASMMQTGQDPAQAIRQLEAVSGDIEKVGEEDVRGVSTTHYRATIDFSKYPELVPAADRAAARASMQQLTKLTGAKTAPVEVWVGEDDLLRRFKQKLRLEIPGAGASSIEQQFELYAFGTKVDITVPDADKVVDASKLAARGAAALTP